MIRRESPIVPEDKAERPTLVWERERAKAVAASDVQAKLIAVDTRRLVMATCSRRGVAGPERVRQYSIPAGADLYRLTSSAATPEFARYEPVFKHVAATFATGTN